VTNTQRYLDDDIFEKGVSETAETSLTILELQESEITSGSLKK
jgi:hypothetical protein